MIMLCPSAAKGKRTMPDYAFHLTFAQYKYTTGNLRELVVVYYMSHNWMSFFVVFPFLLLFAKNMFSIQSPRRLWAQ